MEFEPVFIVLGLAAIISTTIIRYKKLRLERERLNMGEMPDERGKRSLKDGGKIPQAQLQSINELDNRLRNVETIVTDPDFHAQSASPDTQLLILEKLNEMQQRINKLEGKG